MALTVRAADTPALCEQVYRLRYELYVAQMNVPLPHADHRRRMVCEPLDEHALLLAAIDGDEIVGSSRINFGANSMAFGPYADWLFMRRFGSLFPARVSLRSRFMVSPNRRGSVVTARLVIAGYEAQLRRGVELDFTDCRPEQVSLWKRLGYRGVFPKFDYPDDPGHPRHVPLVLVIRDRAHLARRHSVLLRALDGQSEVPGIVSAEPALEELRQVVRSVRAGGPPVAEATQSGTQGALPKVRV